LLSENDSENAKDLARRVLALGLGGDVAAIKFIAERTEGRPLQKLEMSGELNGSVLHEMSDEELDARMQELIRDAGYEIVKGSQQ
jgi:hypothetical protein